MHKYKMSSQKTERSWFVWCDWSALNFNIDWEIECTGYVIFSKPILLANVLGIRQSQSFGDGSGKGLKDSVEQIITKKSIWTVNILS